ncbi:MAG: hypothetical protein M5T61_15035 [Acidimicrobiia bacterium]|nr:hypothetical protein [Acidimicrobiia bacterium]
MHPRAVSRRAHTHLPRSGTLAGLAAFVSYALGMGLVVGVVTVAVAGAQGGLVSWMRRVGPLVSRASGALLVLAGAYVAWYGWWELRGDFGADPVVDRAQSVREWLVARVESLPRGMTAAVLLALVVVVVLRARRLRAGDGAGDGNAGGPDRVPEVSSHSEASHT